MKLKSIIAFLTLSLVMWAQTSKPTPNATPKPGTKSDCACCEGMAKDHTCGDCCKSGKCSNMKDGKCEMMKDAKAACMGEKGCCASMMKHDMADMKGDKSEAKMGMHCDMKAKDGKSCCGGMNHDAASKSEKSSK